MKTTTFHSPTISCGGCARNIKAAMSRQDGVRQIEVDPTTKVVSIEFDESVTDVETLAGALADAGYAPDVVAR